jgi:alpha-ketoglutarate-dependent taurine dioxygenase
MLADHPKIAGQLGEICVQWSSLEAALAQLFAILLLATPLIADEILENIYDSKHKRNILANLAKHRLKNPDRAALTSLLNEYQNLATKRSKYVHGRWLTDKRYPKHAIWVRRVNPNWSHEAELVNEDTLANVVDKITKLRKKFLALVTKDFVGLIGGPPGFTVRNKE